MHENTTRHNEANQEKRKQVGNTAKIIKRKKVIKTKNYQNKTKKKTVPTTMTKQKIFYPSTGRLLF